MQSVHGDLRAVAQHRFDGVGAGDDVVVDGALIAGGRAREHVIHDFALAARMADADAQPPEAFALRGDDVANAVAGALVDGDAFHEIVTGPGPGFVFGPHVRGWNYDNLAISSMPNINYFAYQTPKYGVNVEDGDFDVDAFGELVTGPGPGSIFGPQVRGWNVDGGALTSIGSINYTAYTLAGYGVNVAGGDADGRSTEGARR